MNRCLTMARACALVLRARLQLVELVLPCRASPSPHEGDDEPSAAAGGGRHGRQSRRADDAPPDAVAWQGEHPQEIIANIREALRHVQGL